MTDILKEIAELDPEFESKLNLVVPGSGVTEDLKYPGCLVLDMPMSLQHYSWVIKNDIPLDEETLDYIGIVFTEGEVTEDNWKRQGLGIKHLIGRVDVTLKVFKSKYPVPVVWKYPEDGLHPSAIVNLSDVLIKLWTEYIYPQHWWKSKDF